MLVAVVAAVLGSTVALAATPRSRTITVGDSSLKPTSATVGVGGSVTWTNTGKRRHRIASDTKSWAPFTLSPASRRTVRFKRAGRYPYHVDGKRKGLVVVAAAASSSGPSAGTGGGEAWAGTFETTGTNDGTDRGGQVCTATWKGTLALTVAGKKLTGTGEASLSGTPSCTVTLGTTPQMNHVTFTIDGNDTTTGSNQRLLVIRMHVLTVDPSGPILDAGGFNGYFGQHNEGLPIFLPVNGRTIDLQDKVAATAEVTLDEHFVLTR
jgi:plastocyanin